MKNQACNEDQCSFATSSSVKVPAKRPRLKHMIRSWRVMPTCHFVSTSRNRPSCELPTKHSAWRILNVTFLPFTHTIYTLITHKSIRGHSERKTLDKFSTTQYTHFLERAIYPYWEIIVASSSSLSHCHTLRGDRFPTTHTHPSFREKATHP